MSAEQWEEQVRAIASEVLEGVENVSVERDFVGHWTVGVDQLNEDTGQLLPRPLASTRGDVMRPVCAAKLGLSAQVEELARRLGALGVQPTVAESPRGQQVRAIAREVLEGAGVDGVVSCDAEGHWRVELEAITEGSGVQETWYRLLASTRGDVPMPLLAAKLGLSAQVKELARRLGALGVRPEDEAPLEDEAALIPEALEDLRYGLALGALPLLEILLDDGGGSWPDLEDRGVIRRVLRQFVRDVRVHLAEEKTWPEVIEAERLEAAFEDLRHAGIVAELGVGRTLGEGWETVLARANEQQERAPALWGAAFIPQQDIEDALKGRPLHIAFGVLDESTPEQDAKVGQAVVEALRKHGFEPAWGGGPHSLIQVLPAFRWRRRRSRVDTTEHLELNGFLASLVELLPRLRTLSLEADDMTPYDLAGMRSDSLEELTLQYGLEEQAREALPDVRARVKERFPRLRVLVVKGSDAFEETVHLDE